MIDLGHSSEAFMKQSPSSALKPQKKATKSISVAKLKKVPVKVKKTEIAVVEVVPEDLMPSVSRWTTALVGWAGEKQKQLTNAYENREEIQETLQKTQDRMDLELGRAVRRSITRSPQRGAKVVRAVGAAVKILMKD